MKANYSVQRQSGAVLIVGMIMLVLITLMVTGAYTLSNTNAKSVGNMQFRSEAIAAANQAVEETVASWTLLTTLTQNDINIDINNDGTTDYVVTVETPQCVSAAGVTVTRDDGLGNTSPLITGTIAAPQASFTTVYAVVWDIRARVQNAATGAKITIRQGVTRTINQSQCNSTCGAASGVSCA